jgi:hypothetical protein
LPERKSASIRRASSIQVCSYRRPINSPKCDEFAYSQGRFVVDHALYSSTNNRFILHPSGELYNSWTALRPPPKLLHMPCSADWPFPCPKLLLSADLQQSWQLTLLNILG